MNPEELLLDTHVLIWFLEGSLPASAVATIVDCGIQTPCRYSAASAWEVGLLARPGRNGVPRHVFDPDPVSWFRRLGDVPFFTEAALTPEILIASSQLPGNHHKDPADRMLVATARILDCTLMTRDSEILAYARQGHVKAIPC